MKGNVMLNLNDWDDEIHRALAHPIRRRIIESLQEQNELSFRELLTLTRSGNHGKLGFHLKALRGLVERNKTRKYRLTERGMLAGELILDIRFTIARGRRDLAHEPIRYAKRLRLGDHAILYYDTEDVKHEITFPFLEAGLPKGEAVVYFVSENKLDSECRRIAYFGISDDYFRTGAFTIMSVDEWYLEKGKAHAKTILTNGLALLKEKQKAGFKGLRVAGETDAFFHNAKVEELLTYEAALGRHFDFDLCALCLYNMDWLDEKQVIQLNKYHGHRILKDIALVTT